MRKKERYEKVIAWFQENVPLVAAICRLVRSMRSSSSVLDDASRNRR